MTPKLLLIDNYDSFTYNLVQAFLVLGADVQVYRNDEITVEQALALAPTHVCISPGPGPARGRGRVARHASRPSSAARRSSASASATRAWCITSADASSRRRG